MRVELRKLSSITPYGNNPRVNAHAVEAVAASIRAFGPRVAIVVDRKGVIIKGHTTRLAALSLGLDRYPVHVARDLTPAQARAYRIADNRTGELADWDTAKLATEIDALRSAPGVELADLGWTDDQLAELLATGAPEPKEEHIPPLPRRPVTRPGDLWELGEHRLLCGDSANLNDVQRLMGDDRAHLVLTDPPYGVEYVGKTKAKMRIRNDGRKGLGDMLRVSLHNALMHSRPGAPWFVAGPAGPQSLEFGQVLTELQVWRQTLVWVKDAMVLGHSDFHYRHEIVFYGWAPGRHRGPKGRDHDTVLQFDRPKASDLHPTMKPVDMWLYLLSVGSRARDTVYEPFSGSGTTLVACEQSGRRCHAVELDPRYVDVAVVRWQELTGRQAKLLGSAPVKAAAPFNFRKLVRGETKP